MHESTQETSESNFASLISWEKKLIYIYIILFLFGEKALASRPCHCQRFSNKFEFQNTPKPLCFVFENILKNQQIKYIYIYIQVDNILKSTWSSKIMPNIHLNISGNMILAFLFARTINDIPYLTCLFVIASHFEKYVQVKLISWSSNSPLKKNENPHHHRRSSET